MELFYLYYTGPGKPTRYILLLSLGESDDKYIGLDTSAVSDLDKNKILSSRLSALSLEERIKWLSDNCPETFKKSYREIYKRNAKIENRYKPNFQPISETSC